MHSDRVFFHDPKLRGECSVSANKVILMHCSTGNSFNIKAGHVVMAEVGGVTRELEVEQVFEGAIFFSINNAGC